MGLRPNQVHRRRTKAYLKQKGLCFWCGRPMLQKHELPRLYHPLQVTAEHLIPNSEGGRIVVAACLRCNHSRGKAPLKEWLVRAKMRLISWGNPSWFDVILSNLKELGIEPPIGQPGNGPDAKPELPVPPLKALDPAPKG